MMSTLFVPGVGPSCFPKGELGLVAIYVVRRLPASSCSVIVKFEADIVKNTCFCVE